MAASVWLDELVVLSVLTDEAIVLSVVRVTAGIWPATVTVVLATSPADSCASEAELDVSNLLVDRFEFPTDVKVL